MLKDYRINESHQATDADDDGHHVEQSRLLPDHRLRGSRPELHDQVRQRQADVIPTITAETKVSGTEKNLFLHPCTSKSIPDTFIPSPPAAGTVALRQVLTVSAPWDRVRFDVKSAQCDKRGDVALLRLLLPGSSIGRQTRLQAQPFGRVLGARVPAERSAPADRVAQVLQVAGQQRLVGSRQPHLVAHRRTASQQQWAALGHAASSQGDIASSCRRRAWCVCADLTHPTPTVPVAFHRTGITQPGWVHGSAGSAGDNSQFSSPLLVALGGANPPCREAMILL